MDKCNISEVLKYGKSPDAENVLMQFQTPMGPAMIVRHPGSDEDEMFLRMDTGEYSYCRRYSRDSYSAKAFYLLIGLV